MLKVVQNFRKKIVAVLGLLFALQLNAAEQPRSQVLSPGMWPRSWANRAARPGQQVQPLQASSVSVSSLVPDSASSTALSPVEPVVQPPVSGSPAVETASVQTSTQAVPPAPVYSWQKPMPTTYEELEPTHAPAVTEQPRSRIKDVFAAWKAGSQPIAQEPDTYSLYRGDVNTEKAGNKREQGFLEELNKKERAEKRAARIARESAAVEKSKNDIALRKRAEQEYRAWEDRYEKDLAAEKRDRALFTGRFAEPVSKSRYGQALEQQEQNLVVSQVTDMLRTLNQREAAAHATILKNSGGMFSNLFVSPTEQLMRAKRIEHAKRELNSIWARKEELDAALDQGSVADQLAELEYVQERIDRDPNEFSFERLEELERAAAVERERAARELAEQMTTRQPNPVKRQGQVSRNEAAFGEYGAGAQPAELNLLERMAPGEGENMPVRVQAPAQVGQQKRGADVLQEQEAVLSEQRAQRARERAAQEFGRALEETREPKAVRKQGQKSRYAAFGEYGQGAEQPEFAPIPEPTVGSEQPVAAMEPFVAPEESEGEEYKQAEQGQQENARYSEPPEYR